MMNRLSAYWPVDEPVEAPALKLYKPGDTLDDVADERPYTLSFAEWAPRIRAERAANSCPCHRLPHRCSVCSERSAR